MSYTKQTWATGDVITAQKLNHMEDGIASLSGYDFILNGTDPPTADGLSFDELMQKGSFDLRGCFIDESGLFYDATMRGADESEERVSFGFTDINQTIIDLYSDGTCLYGGGKLSYTYSDGHYVFSGDSPK